MRAALRWSLCGIVLLWLGLGALTWPGAAAGQNDQAADATRLVLDAAPQNVGFVTFSPDGKTLAAGGDRGILKIWDAETGRERTASEPAKDQLYCAAFSPDGKTLATGYSNGSLRVWSSTSGKLTRSPEREHTGPIHALVFSPDGKLLVTCGQDRKLCVWETATWTLARGLVDLPQVILSASISPAGTTLAISMGDPGPLAEGGAVWLYDLATLDARLELPGLKLAMRAVAFTPDGTTLATGSGSSLRFWDAATGQPRSAFRVNLSIRILAFSRDGKQLLVAGWGTTGDPRQGTGLVWDMAAQRPQRIFQGHGSLIFSGSFSPDGRWLATVGQAPEVKLWEVAKLPTLAGPVIRSAVPPPNRAAPSAPFVERARASLEQPPEALILALAYSPDGRLLAHAGEDRTVTLRDAATGAVLKTLAGHTDMVSALAFTPDGTTLASTGYDKTVRLWDVAEGAEKGVLQGHTYWVLAVAFGPDGKTLASASFDKTIRLWDSATAREIATLAGHTASVRALAFAPDGKTVASAGSDRVVKLWDVATRSARATLKGHTKGIRALAFSSDGTLLASGAEDAAIKLWDPATGAERSTLAGHADMITCLAFARGGSQLVSAGWDGVIKLWDAGAAKEEAAFRAHAEAVAALALTPDGQQLATSGYDKRLKLWKAAR